MTTTTTTTITTPKTSAHGLAGGHGKLTGSILALALIAITTGCGNPGRNANERAAADNAAGGGFDVSQLRVRPITTTTNGDSGDVKLTAQSNADAATPNAPPAPGDDPQAYVLGKKTADGTGKYYMGREIAQVMGHMAAGWLEREEREREEQPQKVVEWMDLKKTDVVADIGAGTGYFSFRMADKVPDGKVLATDIQPEMLDLLRRQAAARGVKNVEPVLGKVDDPNLPENGVDVVLMVDAYHEFDHPREMMAGIVKGLKVGGRVVQVEYRGEDPAVPIKPLHKMTQEQAKKEMTAAGLEYVKTFDGLPSQHVMIFRKPEPPAPAPAKPAPKEIVLNDDKAPAAATPVAPEKADDPKRVVLGVVPRFAVAKLDVALAYYRDKLGFHVDREEHGFAVVSREGATFQLIVPEERAAGPRDATQFGADCDAYVQVRDADALHEEFRKNGALIAQPPTKRRGATEFDVATPDGAVIRFAQLSGSADAANANQ